MTAGENINGGIIDISPYNLFKYIHYLKILKYINEL